MDTFAKLVSHDLSTLIPRGTLIDRLMRQSPEASVRAAYSETALFHEVPMPGWALRQVQEGRAGFIRTPQSLVGKRHRFRFSRKQPPIGFLWHGYLVRKGFRLLPEVDGILLRLKEAGVYTHLRDGFTWLKAAPEREHYYRAASKKHTSSATVLDLGHVGLFSALILGTGLLLAAAAFLFWELGPRRKALTLTPVIKVYGIEMERLEG